MEQSATDPALERAFELAGPAGTKAFLESLMENDPLLRRRFISRFGELDVETMKAALAADLERVDYYYGRGYCDSWGDPRCGSEYEQVLSSHIGGVLRRGDAETAFKLLDLVLDDLRDASLQDRDGASFAAIDLYANYLKEVLTAASDASLPALFTSVTAKMDGIAALAGTKREGDYDYWLIRCVRELLVELYAESPLHAHLVRDWAAAQLSAPEPDGRTTGFWALAWLNAMRASDGSTQDMLSFIQPYLGDLDVTVLMAQILEERGDAEGASALLERMLGAFTGRSNTTDEAEAMLLRLYGCLGRDADERTLLEEMLRREHANGCLSIAENLRRYRACWPEDEWPEVREALFSAMECDWKLCDCLREEGLDERLVDTLEKTGGSFERHEQFLLATGHADYVIKCWGKRAWESAARARNRHDYRYVAEELDHIAMLPEGGKAAAQKLADEIRDAYPRRSALDDEIRKVGL